jgi:Flp pilus assembly protein TadD
VYLYVQSLAYDAKNPAPLQKIGAIHEKRGNHALAERAFEMALRLDPDNAATNERLGLLYLQSQRHEAAEALFARAVEKDVKRWQSHNGLGILADRRGEYAAAIAHYDDALAVEPLATTVINNRGYSRYLAGDFAGAEAEYRHALSLGAWGGAWINLGMVQARQRRYEEALDSFLKVHDEAHAHNLLGEVAMEGGDLDTAQNEFMLALSASPRFFEKAQENLEQVAERITEREQREAASGVGGATPESASALPGGTAAAVAVFVPQSTVAYAGKSGYGKKQRQQEGREVSCSGAAALKPRCNPYSVKPNKPYRVAAYKPPKY